MKTIEEIRKKYLCPLCHSNENLSFQEENCHCWNCNADFDGSVIFFVETPFFTSPISSDNLSIFPGNKFQVDLLSNSNYELA